MMCVLSTFTALSTGSRRSLICTRFHLDQFTGSSSTDTGQPSLPVRLRIPTPTDMADNADAQQQLVVIQPNNDDDDAPIQGEWTMLSSSESTPEITKRRPKSLPRTWSYDLENTSTSDSFNCDSDSVYSGTTWQSDCSSPGIIN